MFFVGLFLVVLEKNQNSKNIYFLILFRNLFDFLCIGLYWFSSGLKLKHFLARQKLTVGRRSKEQLWSSLSWETAPGQPSPGDSRKLWWLVFVPFFGQYLSLFWYVFFSLCGLYLSLLWLGIVCFVVRRCNFYVRLCPFQSQYLLLFWSVFVTFVFCISPFVVRICHFQIGFCPPENYQETSSVQIRRGKSSPPWKEAILMREIFQNVWFYIQK